MIPPISPRRSPQLTNEHGFGGQYEQKFVSGMPIGDIFLSIMFKAWANQRIRRRESLSPRRVHLLSDTAVWFSVSNLYIPFFSQAIINCNWTKVRPISRLCTARCTRVLAAVAGCDAYGRIRRMYFPFFIAVSFVA